MTATGRRRYSRSSRKRGHPVVRIARRQLDRIEAGGYGSRTFGFRMVMATSMRTLTMTTMMVK